MASEPLSLLFIKDVDYNEYPGLYQGFGQIAQESWRKYISASQTLIGEKGLEGDRANSYSAFISVANELIGNQLADLLRDIDAYMSIYIEKIDEADSVLYK